MILDNRKKDELVSIGGEAFFLEMLDKFIAQTGDILKQCRSARDAGDRERVKGLLHKLKGSSLTVGTSDVADFVLSAYEKSAREMIAVEDLDSIQSALAALVDHRKTMPG